ncbi:hypothetical protein VTN00DRAFT_6072 [Thermoascus crustaceus]|uniref:uncharacterized protein n=1 Tax=Thermoascus crustaceus TaxID=5088 RepID=UPI003744A987
MRDILGATFGLKHTFKTKVGNDFVRGSLVLLLHTGIIQPVVWTSMSLEFARALRVATNLAGNVIVTKLYQPGDSLVEIYDKVTLLYAGHQIWFGHPNDARRFFQDMGFLNGPSETTAEFLTSITDPIAQKVRKGFEERVPRTPEEFVSRRKDSAYYKKLMTEIEEHTKKYP